MRFRSNEMMFVLGFATLASTMDVCAAPRLHCHLEQGDTVQDLQFETVSNPYTVPSISINDNFRFKAVMMGDARQVAYIKLYTYYRTQRQAVLLHEATYLTPQPQTGTDPASLSGVTHLYSPILGREIKYGCALREEEQ
jgi:hypothetical protein